MKFDIKMQSEYSRGDLILRAFFGIFYILIPHAFLLFFYMIGSLFITLISFFQILLQGAIADGMYQYQVKLLRWNLRVQARMLNMRDGYPAFGMDSTDEGVVFDLQQPATRDKTSVLLRFFFGVWYVMLPHGICLMFLQLAMSFVQMIQFWIILITGKANEGMFNFTLGVIRWSLRVNTFTNYLTDTYPPFTMQATPEEQSALAS